MKHDAGMTHQHYKRLAITTSINAIIMYLVMYTMIDGTADFYNNINQVYMVLMMAAPMVIIMVFDMKSMYTDKRLNLLVHVAAVTLLVFGFVGMRSQLAVGDTQFLRAMIPHHSGAILMCREANLSDAEIKTLCGQIMRSQQEEIDQMKAILDRKP